MTPVDYTEGMDLGGGTSTAVIGSSDSGDDDSLWGNLGALFGTIGTVVGSTYKTVSTTPSSGAPRPIGPGSYYNPQTGQVQTVGGLGGNTGTLLLVGAGLIVVVLLLRR